MLRELMKNEIARVQRGEEPIGVYRDANHAMIETNVDEGVRADAQRRALAFARLLKMIWLSATKVVRGEPVPLVNVLPCQL